MVAQPDLCFCGFGIADLAITAAIGTPIELVEYRINSLSRGKGSLGKVTTQICVHDKRYQGKAIETDVMRASALALINAVNKMVLDEATLVKQP
ncbi:hypothetical protein GH808_02545 [Acetobacterium fimetarium]|uniref:2-isopropylmalate synthase LeuA allosteric (dimerisation) domain-containing protein n=1 Tax=Acetobacterium fimetarium TaxID=52691 RepID=A0ABR6WSH7_9FIRM|nr:alpha-isopropylmalate synthase regulatory domain-containing protein [Acetobacterium fimetarium]MBC3803323.1 hypothetical protein [Acetobacterium fimetarium]